MRTNGKHGSSRQVRGRGVRRTIPMGFVALFTSLAIAGASIGSAPTAGRAKALDNLLFEPGSGPYSLRASFGAIGPVAPFATITVNTTNQEVNTDGNCSLQEAIFSANLNDNKAIDPANPGGPMITTGCTAGSGNDIIVLSNATYSMSSVTEDPANVPGITANPGVSSNITIQGNGAKLQKSGGGNLRTFTVLSGGALTLQNVHIVGFSAKGGNGAAGGGGGLGAGGAVYVNGGSLTVENSTIENNSATGGNGAGQGSTAGGGGGGLGGNGGTESPTAGGGGGGSRGNGALGSPSTSGGGGGGTYQNASGATGGLNCGGAGGPQPSAGGNGTCAGGGGGGGGRGTNGPDVNGGNGGAGAYGGGGGGAGADGPAPGTPGNGGFGGGGGGRAVAGGGAGGNGGFGAGGGSGSPTGTAGTFGGTASSSSGGGGGGLGGAIFNDSGTVTIRNSTFKGNTTTGGTGAGVGNIGGGAVFSRNGTLTTLNSTFSGNSADTNGGAILVLGDGATATVTIRNTILANNGPEDGKLSTVAGGSITAAGSGNLVMLNAGGGSAIPGVVSTTDPNLGALQINTPGNTPTMAITSGSSAFNAADGPTSLATDQRGVMRPQSGGFDIGAFELECTITCPANVVQANDPNQCGAVVTYPAPTTTGSCGTVTCTPASGSFFPVGTTTVTCTTTVGPSCNFTVKVNDTQPPTITCPGGITKFTDPGQLGATVDPGTPIALDNCSVSISAVRSDGKPLNALFPVGVTLINWKATDVGGNTATCSQSILIMVPSSPQRRKIIP